MDKQWIGKWYKEDMGETINIFDETPLRMKMSFTSSGYYNFEPNCVYAVSYTHLVVGALDRLGRRLAGEEQALQMCIRDRTFTITPNTGYEVDYVQVDGTDVSLTDGKYEFKNIAGNHTINVYFKQAGTVSAGAITKDDVDSVSYTHLDVYKRQVYIYSDTIEAIHLEIGFRAGMRRAAQLAGLSAPEQGL